MERISSKSRGVGTHSHYLTGSSQDNSDDELLVESDIGEEQQPNNYLPRFEESLFEDNANSSSGHSNNNSSSKGDLESQKSTLTNATVEKCQSILMKEPDGTFKYASFPEDSDKKKHKKPKSQDSDVISYMDEELQFMLENFEFSNEMAGDMLNDYFMNRRIFFTLLLFQYTLQLYIISMTIMERDAIINRLSVLYKQDIQKVTNVFFASITFDMVMNIVALISGWKAYKNHQIKLFKLFSLIYGFCMVCRIILAYINTWNVIMFIIMLFTYTYSRYMVAMLYGICLVPPNPANLPNRAPANTRAI